MREIEFRVWDSRKKSYFNICYNQNINIIKTKKGNKRIQSRKDL